MYFIEKSKGTNYIKQFDYLFFFLVIILTVIGLFVLDSATQVTSDGTNGEAKMFKQIMGIVIGLVIALVLCFIDYSYLKPAGFILYLGGVGLLVAVLILGTGKEEWGSNSWIALGPLSFQPSEFAKITFIIMGSIFLERIQEKNKVTKNIIKLIIYSVIPIGLILLEPDAGTAIVYMFIFAVMVFICGIPYKYIIGAAAAFVVSTPFIWFFGLKQYQKERILAFLFPGSDTSDTTHQIDRSIVTIGSGKIFGKGLYKGLQTQNAQVPIKDSDFIFTVVGEELGFIGSVTVILLLLFILLRCIYIAKNAREPFGAFLVTGIAAMFAFHFIENIGMCIGLLPITGIPLPFVSYGGTAMIANYIAVGIVLSVSMRRKRTIFNNNQ